MQSEHSRLAHHILTRPQESRTSAYGKWGAFCGGIGAFLGSVVWLVANALALVTENSNLLATQLHTWSDFGQAAGAPLTLANLGVVVISAFFVVKGLQQAESAVKMGYQPSVACSMSLEFDLIGDTRKPHVRIANPKLILIVQNLGDSPATFVEIELAKITLYKAKGNPIALVSTLKQQRAFLDHLSTGGDAVICKIPVLDPNEVDECVRRKEYEDHLTTLVSSLLVSGRRKENMTVGAKTQRLWRRTWNRIRRLLDGWGDSGVAERLECEVQLAHRNVLALAFKGRGTLAWDFKLMRNSPCNPSQIEWVEDFDKVIVALDKATDRGISTKGLSDRIGQYLKRPHALLGVVSH